MCLIVILKLKTRKLLWIWLYKPCILRKVILYCKLKEVQLQQNEKPNNLKQLVCEIDCGNLSNC